jgi:hypothetical protein
MPRPNPPRKRPRRRPDAVERSARAEVSLAKQTAQVKENNGSGDGKRQSSAKAQPAAKGRPPVKGAAGARGRRPDEPYVPWERRSYLVLVGVLFVAELVIGGFYYLTIQGSKPAPPPFGIFLLAVSYQPLLPVAAALVAAPIAKLITKEPRSLRFMESLIVGIVQYFVWLSLFVALTYVGGFESATTTSAGSATTTEIIGLVIIDILSYVAAYYGYPPLYKFMRRRPPPRTAGARKAKPEAAPQAKTSIVDRMDEAPARDSGATGPTA